MKKTLAIILSLAMVFALCACGQEAAPAAETPVTEAPAVEEPAAEEPAAEEPAAEEPAAEETADLGEPVTIQIGFENTMEEPIGQGVQKWADLIEEKSGGNITVELFPNSALGSKSELIDMMEMGEPVITVADTSFCADYGVPDLGICFGPFFFETWEDVWTLIESDWYKGQCELLAEKGVTIVGSNWVYGERELMTKEKVLTPDDLSGMKIRLANSEIYVQGFNALGATAVPMALGDVYTALQNGTLEGVENPLSTLYGQSFQEVCSYILMTGHIKNFSTWLIGTDFFSSLSEAQQEIITSTCEEAGLYNNEKQNELLGDYRAKLEAAGVEITDMTEEEIAVWKAKAASFYELGDSFGWSEGLYETAQAAMGK